VSRFHGKLLRAEQPTEPENLVWANLHLTWGEKCFRRSVSLLVSAGLIALLVLATVYLSRARDDRAALQRACPTSVDFGRSDPDFLALLVRDYESEESQGLASCFCQLRFQDYFDQ